MVSVILAREAIFGQVAVGFDLNLAATGQTFEEAKSEIRGHAQALLQIKSLIESESWGEAQKVLRKNSAVLKQDIYTIIQGKPGSERPELRKLYSNLFNNATRLDYAARDKDASRVWQCYENIVVALNDILSRI
uniref:PsbQ-like protein 3, chloroplastic n=1 Tax=Fagus sylvatica TaxID=28930 RepID=A0A2N9F6L6_FAGSY